jgi:predicted nuclease of predicted toxin-antitoxin system
MKFLLDQNVERRLASFLKNLGHDVKVVSIDYPAGILDQEVLSHAYKESRILLTNDKGDFGELIFRHHHPHSGVILFRRIRSGDMLTKQQRLSFVLQTYTKELHHFLVVSPKSVRVRKAQRRKAT